MWDVLSGVAKNGMGCFVPGCFVLHSIITAVPSISSITTSIITVTSTIWNQVYLFFSCLDRNLDETVQILIRTLDEAV